MWVIFFAALVVIYVVLSNKIKALNSKVADLQTTLQSISQHIELQKLSRRAPKEQDQTTQKQTAQAPTSHKTASQPTASQSTQDNAPNDLTSKPSITEQTDPNLQTDNLDIDSPNVANADVNNPIIAPAYSTTTILDNRDLAESDVESSVNINVDVNSDANAANAELAKDTLAATPVFKLIQPETNSYNIPYQSSHNQNLSNQNIPNQNSPNQGTSLGNTTDSLESTSPNPVLATTEETTATTTDSDAATPASQTSQRMHHDAYEPDEQSIPVVTSLLLSFKNWFFGGNLVIRVGAIVLLMGVVLLLRLLSEYFDTPIEVKLSAIGIIGLAVAGLGLRLVKKRFTYGITLQGVGLSAAYLTTFFAYRVYHVLPSLPSFALLGVLSAVTVSFAVRQNAFPLALLAFSGAFLAPILTSSDTGSITTLFSYYLLLNTAIAVIAHYRTWKVLNVLGATVTFGLAYYWGFADIVHNDFATFIAQRWSLVLITSLHWVLYLFIAIRYAQQIIAYNRSQTDLAANWAANLAAKSPNAVKQAMLFPIDTGLTFATPLLAFGLLSVLLRDVDHALTVASAVMAVTYLGVGWVLAQRSRHYALLTEGMLALGFGFLALIISLELDADWVAFGWSVQGLALVWFGRRSLRAWSVLFGLLLQTVAIISLVGHVMFGSIELSYLALSVSALCWMASMFVLRRVNSPINVKVKSSADQTLMACVNSDSLVFKLIWKAPLLIGLLTLAGVIWTLIVTAIDIGHAFNISTSMFSDFTSLVLLTNLVAYWVINRYRKWQEVSVLNHGLLCLFYLTLLFVLPERYDLYSANFAMNWVMFGLFIVGWLVMGQLWLKSWVADYQLARQEANRGTHQEANQEANREAYISSTVLTAPDVAKSSTLLGALLGISHPTLWLMTGIILLTELAHYLIPDSRGSHNVMTVIIPSLALIALIYLAKGKLAKLTPWFNWPNALIGCAYLFIPVLLGWVLITNVYYDGIVWGLPYIPLLNLYDIALLLALAYGLAMYYLLSHYLSPKAYKSSKASKLSNQLAQLSVHRPQTTGLANMLLNAVVAIAIWTLLSMVVRTLHAYAATPLWIDGAWRSDKVQISLAIFWTLSAFFTRYKLARWLPQFNWHKVLIASSYVFIPILFGWAVLSNVYHDGVVWGLPYIPILNLYDIAVILVLAYGLNCHFLNRSDVNGDLGSATSGQLKPNILLNLVGITAIWFISSLLVRTLHAYANTPLWPDGAWISDKVQICLAIFWTLAAFFMQYKLPRYLPQFDCHKALFASSYVFIPMLFSWVVISNWYYDGVVWGLPYIPILNLYDIALLLALAYGLNVHYLADGLRRPNAHLIDPLTAPLSEQQTNILLKVVGLTGFWVLSSMLVRTLHTYAGTPLWSDGAWGSDKVQTGLTILWTLSALLATFMSSRNGKRFWWFMGISLLGAVVLKLVLVDLSQTDAIWRVVSFIGAGSLILLIGYLAPLPPEEDSTDTEVKGVKQLDDKAVKDKEETP